MENIQAVCAFNVILVGIVHFICQSGFNDAGTVEEG
jgi:hypothetical protein